MLQYLIRRGFQSVGIVLALLAVIFFAINVLGDPISLMLPGDAPQEQVLALRKAYGYDRPLYVRFVDFYSHFLRGDFGVSIRYQRPVESLVLQRLGNTAILASAGICLSLLGIPLGLLAARRPGKAIDRIVTVASFASISTPEFWIGLMLILIVAVKWGWLPTSGFAGPTELKYLILPAITLALNPIGRYAQITRAAVVEEIGRQYVTTAHSKGLSERTILWVHVMKNAAITIVTLGGHQLAGLMNGSTVIESVFGWPGLGLLIIQGIQARDLPVVAASIFVAALFVILINFTVDFMYVRLDPRVKYA
ncbi:MAG: ABC transporter permease [Chloroflexi bacterium]|nr:ABC transporter permease [Chloroflexota bacterium]